MKNSTAGVAIAVIGLIVLAGGAAIWLLSPSGNTNLLATNNYLVKSGDEVSIGLSLSQGQTVSGTFTQVNGTRGMFYIMSQPQQNFFGNCQPCAAPALLNASDKPTYSYSWTASAAGTYYLVVDNSYGKKEAVTLTAATVVSSSNTTISYAMIGVGIVLLIVGAVVAMRKTKPKAPMPAPTAQPPQTPETAQKG
jgi:hypothetical protein